jgi:hypothetical protein
LILVENKLKRLAAHTPIKFEAPKTMPFNLGLSLDRKVSY